VGRGGTRSAQAASAVGRGGTRSAQAPWAVGRGDTMLVAGVMSGTSLDGIDVAIIDIQGKRIRPLAFHSTPYPKAVREALLGVSNAMTHTANIARLHFLLGELYADSVKRASRRHKPALIGMHGQTIFHEGSAVEYLGRRVASTLQIGEAAVVAERTGIQTVSNFRERD